MKLTAMAVTGMLAVVVCAGTPAAERDEAPPGSLRGRALSAYYRELDDSDRGRLAPLTARLMTLGQRIPRAIELPRLQVVTVARAEAEPGRESPPIEVEREGEAWEQVLGRPVVEQEKLAWVLYRAGSYARAADAYGPLHEADPENEHLTVMLALSERNAAGPERLARARKLLDSLPEGSEAHGWGCST